MFDVYKARRDFPILAQKINGKPNAFLDSAASAQKPAAVVERMATAYLDSYANVHRGAYQLSARSTLMYEESRQTVRNFIGAASEKEIVFVRNATEGINLVAQTWARHSLKKGDEIVVSEAEHHANLVVWQELARELGLVLKVFKVGDDGGFVMDSFASSLSKRTKLVAVTGMSNVLGTVFPLREIIGAAHDAGAKVLVDACQYIVHHSVDVADLGCDFLVFSGHKLYGPTGIGVLYGRLGLLESMPPYQFGGDMVESVSYERATFAPPPARFEAGTPAIVEAIGLAEAMRYLSAPGRAKVFEHERKLAEYAAERLAGIAGLTMVGTASGKGGIFSFAMDKVHAADLAFLLDKEGVSVRAGHHCAQPLVNRFGHRSLARVSLALYSTREDVEQLAAAIEKAKTFF